MPRRVYEVIRVGVLHSSADPYFEMRRDAFSAQGASVDQKTD
jgi:hypothetical protein